MTVAVVLGGGGSVGTAWQTGLLAGWAQNCVDLSAVDLILGTSAGAGVGVQLALGHDLGQQVDRYRVSRARFERGGPTAVFNFDPAQAQVVKDLYTAGHARGRSDRTVRCQISEAAASAETVSEDQFLRTFRYLLGTRWPSNYVCTTLDIDTAEFVALDRSADDGSDDRLARGVAAAVAVPGVYPAITIGGHRYVDGGCLSTTFLDLAAGYDMIVAVLMTDLDVRELEAVQRSAKSLFVVRPDAASVASFGDDMMSAVRAFDAVETGLTQGRTAFSDLASYLDGGTPAPAGSAAL